MGFAHCLNPDFIASINLDNNDTNILTKFLLLSDNFFLILVIKVFKPLGKIRILAEINIFSIESHASFFSAHFGLLSNLIICGVIFFEISCGGIKSLLFPPAPDFVSPFSKTLAAFFFLLEVSLGSITLTLSNSASINFNVDSFISLVKVLTSLPKYLYKIHNKLIAEVLTCGFELLANTLQKSIISLFGKSFTSYSSTTFPKKVAYSINNLALFFLEIFVIICFNIFVGSIISKLVLINSIILSFNLISDNFS